MSKVDVLAVLDRLTNAAELAVEMSAGVGQQIIFADLKNARAAIAALIEAADKYLDDSRLESRLDLIDALKAVQGPQA